MDGITWLSHQQLQDGGLVVPAGTCQELEPLQIPNHYDMVHTSCTIENQAKLYVSTV